MFTFAGTGPHFYCFDKLFIDSCILKIKLNTCCILRRWHKPRNIFVTETFVIVVRNYYLSKSFIDGVGVTFTMSGNDSNLSSFS